MQIYISLKIKVKTKIETGNVNAYPAMLGIIIFELGIIFSHLNTASPEPKWLNIDRTFMIAMTLKW